MVFDKEIEGAIYSYFSHIVPLYDHCNYWACNSYIHPKSLHILLSCVLDSFCVLVILLNNYEKNYRAPETCSSEHSSSHIKPESYLPLTYQV